MILPKTKEGLDFFLKKEGSDFTPCGTVCIYHSFIIEYTHISYSITQRRIVDACFTESDFITTKHYVHKH